MVYGTYEQLWQDDPEVIAYTRSYEGEKWLVAVNYSEKERTVGLSELVKEGELLLSNYENQETDQLSPYEARIYRFA